MVQAQTEVVNWKPSLATTLAMDEANEAVVVAVNAARVNAANGEGPRLIVIEGQTTSGKTTILRRLRDSWGVPLLSARDTVPYMVKVSSGQPAVLVDEIDRGRNMWHGLRRLLFAPTFRGALVVTCEVRPTWLDSVEGGYVLVKSIPASAL